MEDLSDPLLGSRSGESVSNARPPAFLIAGAGGMLGRSLQRVLRERGLRFDARNHSDLDITDEMSAERAARAFATGVGDGVSGVIVNAAAYTDVEGAEDEKERAFRINAWGPGVLARAARRWGLAFVHISTDFVFDGLKEGGYSETDVPNPISVYGASKLAGERAVFEVSPDALVLRTAWAFVYPGVNFPLKVLARARSGEAVRVVTDEIGSPTYSLDLAEGIVGLLQVGASGLVHLTNEGACSRYEFAVEVLERCRIDVPVQPIVARDLVSKAHRPANSVLDSSKAAALGVTLPSWKDAVARFVETLPQEVTT